MKYYFQFDDQNYGMTFFQNEKQEIQSYSLFQKTVKSKLIETEIEVMYF